MSLVFVSWYWGGCVKMKIKMNDLETEKGGKEIKCKI